MQMCIGRIDFASPNALARVEGCSSQTKHNLAMLRSNKPNVLSNVCPTTAPSPGTWMLKVAIGGRPDTTANASKLMSLEIDFDFSSDDETGARSVLAKDDHVFMYASLQSTTDVTSYESVSCKVGF